MRLSVLTASAALVFAASAFAADAPAPGLVRGTIASFDGKTLSLTTKDGVKTGAFTPKSVIFTVVPLKFDQLKSTDFVGITAVDGENGHLQAEEIHVIPIVGVGEGQYPWDHHPDTATGPVRAGSMTNGTLMPMPQRAGSMTNGMITPGSNMQLTVTFHGSEVVNGKCVGHAPKDGKGACTGTSIVDVKPTTPIVALVPGKPEDVKPGLAAVGGMAVVNGAPIFGSITVEKNGVKPEF
jgi:hypothetical protein